MSNETSLLHTSLRPVTDKQQTTDRNLLPLRIQRNRFRAASDRDLRLELCDALCRDYAR